MSNTRRSLSTGVMKLTYSAMFLALAYVLPFLTGSNRALGNILCLMHIPVLMCGFVCGWPWGAAVGLIAPLLRSVTIGMPPMPVVAVPMAFELLTYGLLAGMLYKCFANKAWGIYAALICAMIGGRIILGVANFVVYGLRSMTYSLEMLWTSGFVTALPGIGIQIVLIPLLVMALKKTGLMLNK